MKKYLITIVGPTAIGKTALSIQIAKHFKTEIISSDSRQFYKEMSIGTAVPSASELSQVPHHFIQNRSIHDDFSVGQFERDALHVLTELFKIREVVVMVGGSGLYVDAILKGLDYFPDIDPQIRVLLKKELVANGIHHLQEQLQRLDPKTYQQIDLDNHQRVIRALEVCRGTGKPYSSYLNASATTRNFIPVKIGLTADRQLIYDRINQRVDLMLQQGLLEEAKALYPYKELNALQTVGYKELFAYMDGTISFEEAVEEIKKNTRRFAKRQLTWYRKDSDIQWFDYQEDITNIIQFIKKESR